MPDPSFYAIWADLKGSTLITSRYRRKMIQTEKVSPGVKGRTGPNSNGNAKFLQKTSIPEKSGTAMRVRVKK